MTAHLFGPFAYLHIPVTNMDESLAWYERNLGAQITGKPHPDLGFLEFPHGPNVLLIGMNRPDRTAFYRGKELNQIGRFRSTRIEELRGKLSEAGADVTPLVREGHGDSFRFFDPNGNLFMAHEVPA
ncbi:VOC family protein [Paenibacillus sp. GYB003]|uniref:VOC family protein n=1 Tax=Paenibacillus sp. GYB003 TaxID=2994392 RepID=UPI002F96AC88